MASSSTIEWTGSTWNPVTGCTKISSGCKNCYAERMAKRLQAMGQQNYVNGFQLAMHPHVVELPLRWKKPQTIFVNSMSDLFHKEVSTDFILRIFDVMLKTPWHKYQVLTKRSKRLKGLNSKIQWAPNIWMGVTVESEDVVERIDDLSETDAHVKFLSCEPLLSPLNNLKLQDINWVIVGGESGPRSRPIQEEWAIGIREQCVEAAVPFFFKQWGGFNKKKKGRLLQGKIWDEMPQVFNEVMV